ncbi:hypothetical protein LR48_Vigan04g190100 [Vigna angularis]|uniref:Uncharacterized protein n=1 Tax=Phaseolus angularis TaxID=3914 RepID=A0A0L9UG29_PHAAN|nr:hypothetical protein LR48_Vigan04g190100 [Vigna angularis]
MRIWDFANPFSQIQLHPSEPAEGFVTPPSFDDGPLKTEDEIAAAYEELYGPTFSGVFVLGNDVFETDALVKQDTGFGSNTKKEKVRDGFEDRVVQVRRVMKVVKGGKQLPPSPPFRSRRRRSKVRLQCQEEHREGAND